MLLPYLHFINIVVAHKKTLMVYFYFDYKPDNNKIRLVQPIKNVTPNEREGIYFNNKYAFKW